MKKANSEIKSERKFKPALTPEARENQMISLASDLAEQQLRNGTASTQVITHYLRLGTEKERLERAKLEREVALLEAKKHAYESATEMKELYLEALAAMKEYSGRDDSDDEEDL